MGKLAHGDVGISISDTEWLANTTHTIGGTSGLEITRSASYVIAASDSSAAGKAQADATCDGTNDNVEIQAGIDALTSGGAIQLLEGNFYIGSSIALAAGVNIVGQGGGTLYPATKVQLAANTNMFTAALAGHSNINLKDMCLCATGYTGRLISAVETHTISFANVYFYDADTAVYAEYCWHWRFTNCTFDECGTGTGANAAMHIFNGAVDNSSDWWLVDCTWEPCGGDQIYFDSTGVGIDNSLFYFTGCKFENTPGESWNFITGSAQGIIIHGGAMVRATTAIAFALQECVLSGTRFVLSATADVHVTSNGNSITGIVSSGAGTNGIWLESGNYNSILGNTVTQKDAGIRLTTANSNTLNGNNLYGCAVDGILIDNSEHNNITGNVCASNGDDGIEITAGSWMNLVTNNRLVSNGGTNLVDAGTTVIRSNPDWVTENSGTATLLNANTSIVVAHGCSATPTLITITWAENPTNAIADWWVDTIGATNFTLNGVDPGASNLDFMWEAKVR